MVIMTRLLREISTDPQRRCYHGCHAKSELVWSGWKRLEHISPEKAAERIKFWEELNDYAVSQRGRNGTKREFKIEEEEN